MSKIKEEYLGDGLYVSFDGDQIRLRAPDENGDHIMYMDYHVWSAFKNYGVRVMAPIHMIAST